MQETGCRLSQAIAEGYEYKGAFCHTQLEI